MKHAFSLRQLLLGVAAAVLCTLAAAPHPARAATLVKVTASRLAFYYDRFLLEGDGNVRVTTSDGQVLTGDAFSMDLKLDRFVLAGHVRATSPAGTAEGAALADFLAQNRIYFIPITSEPDRWTFISGDFAHPSKGRIMPGDTFYFPDLGKAPPFMVSHSATVGDNSFIRMGPGRVDLAQGVGAYVPVPSFYINFSSDPHMGVNSLAGANFDATYQFAGNANAISALHFRYDTFNKTYLSFEQHLSARNEYAVFSINPATRPLKFWNLVTGFTGSDTFQVHTFTQLHTYQYGLSQPLESGQFTILQLTKALPHSYLFLNSQYTNYDLLADNGTGFVQGHSYITNHPLQSTFGWQTFDNRIGKLPLYEHLTWTFGVQHDDLGLASLGGVPYTTIWQKSAGLTLYTPQLKLGHSDIPTKNLYLNAIFQKTRQWNSMPHYVDTTDTRIGLSKMFDRHWLSFTQYEVDNVGDYYGAQQLLAYPRIVPVVNGVSYPGYAAFRGLATFRTLSLGLNYTNGSDFNFSLLARQHDDFPKPIPFYFQLPPTDFLGNQLPGNFLGQPPYDITADVRFRINPELSLDIQRSYYFNYENRRWSPQFIFQFLQ